MWEGRGLVWVWLEEGEEGEKKGGKGREREENGEEGYVPGVGGDGV